MNYFYKLKNMFKKENPDNSNNNLIKDEKALTPFLNQAKGSLYGLYIGDALGAPLEFVSMTEEDGKIDNYVQGGVHKVAKGQFTDDTSMALALMDSLTNNGFDLKDQMDKYLEWQSQGKYSSKGYCFDIGITTIKAIEKYKITKNPVSGGSEHYHSGNGSLMRLAPVPLFYYHEGIKSMIEHSIESSTTTHQSEIVLDNIKYFTIIFNKILNGERDKNKLIRLTDEELKEYKIKNETIIKELHEFDYENVKTNKLNTGGFCIYSTIVALHCLSTTKNFKDAVLKAVNLGGDADTNGAITGQLAGAYYGFNKIPKNLVQGLNPKSMIDQYTEPFMDILEEKENQKK